MAEVTKRPKPPPQGIERGIDALGRPTHEIESSIDRADANDPKAFDQAKREEQARRRSDDLVVQQIMDARSGRDWMYRKLAAMHIYETTFIPGQPDTTAFKLGEENIGKQFLADLQRSCPSQYLLMLSEQNEKRDAS